MTAEASAAAVLSMEEEQARGGHVAALARNPIRRHVAPAELRHSRVGVVRAPAVGAGVGAGEDSAGVSAAVSAGVSGVLDEHPDDLEVAVLGGGVQWRPVVARVPARRRRSAQQPPHHVAVTKRSSDEERLRAVVIGAVDARLGGDEHADDVRMTLRARGVQWGGAASHRVLDPRAHAEQVLDHIQVAGRSGEEEGAGAIGRGRAVDERRLRVREGAHDVQAPRLRASEQARRRRSLLSHRRLLHNAQNFVSRLGGDQTCY